MQLDACLRSIERFAPYAGRTTVIYEASTQDFAAGYAVIANSLEADLVEQSTFRSDVLGALGDDHEYSVFHTDDDVFFRAPPAVLLPARGFAAVSLRLGLNTTYCYSLDALQPLPRISTRGPCICWDWTRAQYDFAYPLSLDGHIVQTELLEKLLKSARFTNPNELEEELHLRRQKLPRYCLGFSQSCVVSIPVNLVSSTHTNRAGTDPTLSSEALNQRFLEGERIALESMDFSSIRGAHQEVTLRFERRAKRA